MAGRFAWYFGLSLIIAGAFAFQSCSAPTRSDQYEKSKTNNMDESYYYGPESFQKQDPVTERAKLLGQPKARTVIFEFWNDTPVQDPQIGNLAANELRRELHLTRKVLLPTEIQTNLGSKDFVDGNKIRVEQLIREGRRLGVNVIVIGRVAQIVFRQKGDEIGIFRNKESLASVDLEVKIYDTETGREVAAIGKAGLANSDSNVVMEDDNLESRQFRRELVGLAVRDAAKRLVPEVVRSMEKMQWQGKIAKIIGNQVYLNSGRESGLIKGDILRVMTSGEDVYDPESGAFLGRTQGQLKGTLEVVDFIGKDAATAVIHTGGTATEGDTVRLY
jgi:hypothetical protein